MTILLNFCFLFSLLFDKEVILKGKAAVGFEPTSHGFANQCLSPLGHAALRPADYIQNCGIIKHKAEKSKICPRTYGECLQDSVNVREDNGIAKRRFCDYNCMLVADVPYGLYNFDIARTKWRTK